MIIEAFYHAFSLDFSWFIDITMNNLLWVFIFFAAANILDYSKSTLGAIGLFFFFVYDLFTEMTFSQASGWVFTGAQFLFLLYFTRTIVHIWCETTPSLQRHSVKILALHWLIVYSAYSIFTGV